MKIKLSLFSAALVVGALGLVLSSSSFAQYGSQQGAQPAAGAKPTPGGKKPGEVLTGGAIVATPITQEEAMKKYPPPNGKSYPPGDRDNHQPSGWIYSPYTRTLYDCSNIPWGRLALDTKVNKVFVRPKTK